MKRTVYGICALLIATLIFSSSTFAGKPSTIRGLAKQLEKEYSTRLLPKDKSQYDGCMVDVRKVCTYTLLKTVEVVVVSPDKSESIAEVSTLFFLNDEQSLLQVRRVMISVMKILLGDISNRSAAENFDAAIRDIRSQKISKAAKVATDIGGARLLLDAISEDYVLFTVELK